jgi:hypothetical protein
MRWWRVAITAAVVVIGLLALGRVFAFFGDTLITRKSTRSWIVPLDRSRGATWIDVSAARPPPEL